MRHIGHGFAIAVAVVAMLVLAGSAWAQSGIVTGLSQLTKDKDVDLYPNAAKTQVAIVFESFKDKNFEVILMKPDGVPRRQTTDEEDNNNAAWLKGDEGFLFDSYRQKMRGVWLKSLSVGGDQQISRGKTVDFDAEANPVTGRVVFCAVEDEKNVKMREDGERWIRAFKNEMPYIWFVNPDGSGLTQLIKGINPTWSPDGERIAFASNVTGNYEIYSIKPDGSGLLQLTSRAEAPDIEPTWSPDGRKIAFTSYVNKDWNLWMMNADGTGLTQLTTEEGLDGGPSWGIDGFIYFHSERSGNYDIWKFKPAGYEPVPVDADKDGVPDKNDKCPDQPEDMDGYQDEDGCPDPDNDNDGVPDAQDKCPMEPEDKNGYQDDDGCPDNNPLAGGVTLYIDFMANNQIKPDSFFQLDQIVDKVKSTTGTIEIRSFTDGQKTDAAALKLTQARADAVKSYFIQRGIESTRLMSIGYGKANPIDSNSSASGRANNNRIEIHLIK